MNCSLDCFVMYVILKRYTCKMYIYRKCNNPKSFKSVNKTYKSEQGSIATGDGDDIM